MRLTLRHKGSSRELIKRWELVFTAEVKSYISFRQPSDSHGGARSFSNTKLFYKRVLKECNKRLLKNAEINKSDFKVFFSSSKRNSGLVSTQKGDVHLVQHIFAYALMRYNLPPADLLFVSACDPQSPRRTKSCLSEEYPHGPSDQCTQTELNFKKYLLLTPKY